MAEARQQARRKAPAHPGREGATPAAAGDWAGLLFRLAVLLGVVGVAALPVVAGRIMNDEAVTEAFLAPLMIWAGVAVLGVWASRRSVFSGDATFVMLTLALLGLGVTEQLRLGTWAETWQAWRVYAPLLAGAAGFLGAVRLLSPGMLARGVAALRWLLWLAALGVLGALYCLGRRYRGGMFLPGQINPTELVKLLLVAFSAAWLPRHAQGLSRTVCGVPLPPLHEALQLAVVWGVPLAGVVAVRDLGLLLILCLTLMLMLAGITRRAGWLVIGVGAAAAAGWAIRFLSTHTAARFAVWIDPFADPMGKGWQIGQSLCAQFAGGLWGTGIGEGTPGAVPIVTSDFVYAALAEEWGLVGCALLLALYWLWLWRGARGAAAAESPVCRLLGLGLVSVMGVQIVLNVGGVTKALPMTGITLPFFSQGGFSLMTVLLMSGLLAALGRQAPAPENKGGREPKRPAAKED